MMASAIVPPPGLVAFYLTGGPAMRERPRRMTDTEVFHSLQRADVWTQLAEQGRDGLSPAADTFFTKRPADFPDVTAYLDRIAISRASKHCAIDLGSHGATGGAMSESWVMKAINRRRDPVKPPQPISDGLTIADMAARVGVDRATAARLLEAAGWLEMAPCGRKQSRLLIPDAAIIAGYGDNLSSTLHSIGLREAAQSAVFPVFSPEKAEDIIWTLGWDAITDGVTAFPTRKQKAAWLLEKHGYLPDRTIADLSGLGLRTIERHRQEARA